MTTKLTILYSYNSLNFNCLGLVVCIKMLERELYNTSAVLGFNKIDRIIFLSNLSCLIGSIILFLEYSLTKFNNLSIVDKAFRVKSFYICCRLKFSRSKIYLWQNYIQQWCVAITCYCFFMSIK